MIYRVVFQKYLESQKAVGLVIEDMKVHTYAVEACGALTLLAAIAVPHVEGEPDRIKLMPVFSIPPGAWAGIEAVPDESAKSALEL